MCVCAAVARSSRHVDTDRLQPAIDPLGRYLMIGQGTFRELLLLALLDRLRRFRDATRDLVPTRRARDAA